MAGTPAVGLQRVGTVPTTAASSCSSAAPPTYMVVELPHRLARGVTTVTFDGPGPLGLLLAKNDDWQRVRRPSADFQFKFANTIRMTGR